MNLDPVFQQAATQYGLDPDLLRAQASVESNGNAGAISPKGAVGLMQMMPETAKALGIDPTDPTQSIYGAAALMRQNLDRYKGNLEQAVSAYHGGTDQANWGPLTQQYVSKVANTFGNIKQNAGIVPASAAQDSSDPVVAAMLGARQGSPGAPQAAPADTDPVIAAMTGAPQQAVAQQASSGGATGSWGEGSGDASSGGVGSGFVQGLKDSINGPAQLLYNALPKGAQQAGDAADNWLYANTGGAVGTAPGGLNAAIANQNKGYEADRAAAGRTGFDFARTGGNVVGSLPIAIASGGGAVPASMIGAVTRGALAGALTGAAQPVTDNPDSYWGEKGVQVGTGAVAGGAGAWMTRAVASVASPIIGKAQQALIDAGMTLTPGQILGGALKTAEEKLASVPILGSFIKSAQGRTVEDLNRAAYARVLAPLEQAGIDVSIPTEVGHDAITSITNQVKSAYNDKLIPGMFLRVDPQLTSELGTLSTMAAQGLEPTQAQRFASVMTSKVNENLASGGASGKTLQGMLSDLGSMAAGYKSDPSFANRQLGDALLSVEQSIKDGLSRTNPAQGALLSKVDEAFANLARVQTAAAGQGTSGGVFSAAQLSAAVKGGDETVRDNAFARGSALMQDLSGPAKSVMGATVPNSGTADRGMLAYLLAAGAGGATINPGIAAAGGIAALPYTSVGQKAVQAALTSRPESARVLAEILRRYSTPIAASAAPALIGANRP